MVEVGYNVNVGDVVIVFQFLQLIKVKDDKVSQDGKYSGLVGKL